MTQVQVHPEVMRAPILRGRMLVRLPEQIPSRQTHRLIRLRLSLARRRMVVIHLAVARENRLDPLGFGRRSWWDYG